MAIIGYARVSTDGQSLQSQTVALQGVGCARIFAEKISGAYSDRPQLAKALTALTEGDTLVVCKLDRLARSTHPRLAQHSGCYCRRWRKLPVVGRSLVRHDKRARQADSDGAWRPCGVREASDAG